jgi:hypothetical protein
VLSLSVSLLACAPNPLSQEPGPGPSTQVVLAPGQAHRVPEADLTLTFVRVTGDSRCPTGVTCIREGDAAVLVRVDGPGSATDDLTLHTSGPGSQDVVVHGMLVTVVDVMPYPREDHVPRADEYRVTLLIRKK